MIDTGGPVAYWVEGAMSAEMLENWDGRGCDAAHILVTFETHVCHALVAFETDRWSCFAQD